MGNSETWSLVRFETPMWTEDDLPHRLHAFVVLGDDGNVLAQDLVEPQATHERAAEALKSALTSPLRGKVRTPAVVRVEDEALAPIARAVLGARGVTVEVVGAIEEADAFFRAMRERLPFRVPKETFARCGASKELLHDYCAAFKALDALKPWEHSREDQLVALSIPALELDDATITIMSDADNGLTVHEGDDVMAIDDLEAGERSEREMFEHGQITGQLGSLFNASAEMAAELRRLGLSGDETRVPLPRMLGKDGCARLLTVRDLQVLTAAALALTRLFETDADVFEATSEKEVSHVYDLTIAGESFSVRLEAPHPRFGWMTMKEPDDFRDELDEDALAEEGTFVRGDLDDTERALLAAFVRSVADRDEEWRLRAERIVVELFDYTRASEAKFGEWTMGELERFVLEDLPHYEQDRVTLALAPEVVVTLARFLQSERVPRIDLPAIEKRMRKIRPRLDELLEARHTKLLA